MFASLLGLLSLTADAADLYVCADTATCSHSAECLATPSDCFITVQGAIDGAAPNDTIHLSDETYTEEVDSNPAATPLTIVGEGTGVTTIIGDAGGEGIDFAGVVSTWKDLTITTPAGANRHCLKIDGGEATLERVEITGCQQDQGAGLEVTNDALLTITTGHFHDNLADGNGKGGAHIRVTSGVVDIVGTLFENGHATSDDQAQGGAIWIEGGDVTLSGTSFTDHSTTGRGGTVAISAGALFVRSSMITQSVSADMGGAIAASADLIVENGLFASNISPLEGGAVYCSGGERCEVRYTTFLANESDFGAALAVEAIENVVVMGSVFCNNRALAAFAEGGAVHADASGVTLANNAFLGNESGDRGGALYATGLSDVESSNNTWAGNTSATTGAVLWAGGATVASLNDLFLANGGPDEVVTQVGATLDLSYGLFFGNTAGDTTGTTGPGMVYTDPLLAWTPPSCDVAGLVVPSGSPAEDAGDPNLFDLDTTRSDIGVFGGPGATECLGYNVDDDFDGLADACDPCPMDAHETDLDGDGYWSCDDCIDLDANAYPGAYDIPGDGIDQDCDGLDAGGGTGTATGTVTTPGVGTPGGNSRGWGGEPTEPSKIGGAVGCGCTSTPSPASGWLVVLVLLGLRARSGCAAP